MVEINIEYSGGLRCQAVHGPSECELITDAPVDNHGKGESFSPTDLVATALASCVATIMGIYAERNELDLTGVKIRVEKHMSDDAPRRIARLPLTIEMPAGLSDKHRAALEKSARHCPVHQSLRADIDSPMTFRYSDE